MAEPEPTDWAYAAAFVDGEGCIAVVRSFVPRADRFYYGVQIVVANRDRAVLDWMQSTWGGWVVAVSARPEGTRQCWNWRCPSGLSAKPFLTGLRPWLKIKGPHCDNALEMIEVMKLSRYTLGRKQLPEEWLARQEQHYWLQRELNHRGTHAFVAEPMHSPRRIHSARLNSRVLGT